MTSIIKHQIVKHLSVFAKNLTPDKISLDVLKGKSELKNIELNEEVLTKVLELPSWLRIRKATCNRIAVKIRWTQLKSVPVELFIDEIQVELVLTSEKPGNTKKAGVSVPLESRAAPSSIDMFAMRVVEGMSLYVNTLEMHFDSGAFGGSFMLSRLAVESRTPGWAHPKELRQSRLSCASTNRTISYKQVSWQLLRVEASAHNEGESAQRNVINAPLRLITSGGKIRIALKKNSHDGTVLHARIMMILEDILWVATLPQLQSAIAFYSHIMKLVNAANVYNTPPEIPAKTPLTLAPHDKAQGLPSTTFANFDFNQTSYHLNVKKIDLHLCDDAHSKDVYPPKWDIESGAMQVTLNTVLIDVYPKTLVAGDRSKWVRYESQNAAVVHLEESVRTHYARLLEASHDETTRTRITRCWPQMMSFNVVFRVLDMAVQAVSDLQTKRDALMNVFTSDKAAKMNFPTDQFVFHAEFAHFYHPMSDSLPVPPPLTHLQMGPFELLFHERTIRWCLYVASKIASSIIDAESLPGEPLPATDLRLDLLMPKLIINLPDPSSDVRLPHRLTVSLSTLTLSNQPIDVQNTFKLLPDHYTNFLNGLKLPAGQEMLKSDLLQVSTNYTAAGLAEGDQLWLHTSPIWAETDHGPKTKGILLLSDLPLKGTILLRKEQLNIFVEPSTAVSLQVDHFQLLQLTRFSNGLSQFLDIIATDADFLVKGELADAPTVLVAVGISQVKVHLILTMGSIASPYEACPAITQATIIESTSFTESDSPPPASTPLPIPPEAVPESRVVVVEEFPEFPTNGVAGVVDLDLVSNFDETMSFTTDDDPDFAPTEMQNPFEIAEVAEDAMNSDLPMQLEKEDRHYKMVMAKNVNVLHATLEDICVAVSVHKKDTVVTGTAQSLFVSQQMNELRSDIYSALHALLGSPPTIKKSAKPPKITFSFAAPAKVDFATLNIIGKGLDLRLEDEIIAHLSPFIQDDQVTENKLRLTIKLEDSVVEINDPKKKKPFRLRLKEAFIEQDED